MNAIGEKLIVEHDVADWFYIRRLPMDCLDSADKMCDENKENLENLPFIYIPEFPYNSGSES